MNCPNCNAEAGTGKFCRSCGSPLTTPKKIVCSGCGTEILSTTKFCPKCGTRLAAIEATAGQICPTCNAPLEPGAKFCKSCGQPTGAAPPLAVVEPAAVPAAAAVATRMISPPIAPGSVASAPLPPTAPVPVTPVATPIPVEAFPVEPEAEPISPSPSGRKPIVWIGAILVIVAVAMLTWWFGFRTPPVNNAPVVKGPLYDQPAH